MWRTINARFHITEYFLKVAVKSTKYMSSRRWGRKSSRINRRCRKDRVSAKGRVQVEAEVLCEKNKAEVKKSRVRRWLDGVLAIGSLIRLLKMVYEIVMGL